MFKLFGIVIVKLGELSPRSCSGEKRVVYNVVDVWVGLLDVSQSFGQTLLTALVIVASLEVALLLGVDGGDPVAPDPDDCTC